MARFNITIELANEKNLDKALATIAFSVNQNKTIPPGDNIINTANGKVVGHYTLEQESLELKLTSEDLKLLAEMKIGA